MSSKKNDLKAELTDMLLSDEDSEKSISQILKDEAVTIGSPDQTELLRKKHLRALEDKRRRESANKDAPDSERAKESRLKASRESAKTPLPSVAVPSSPAVAQSRIEQLEAEVDNLRSENQKYEATTDALRAQVEEMSKRLIEWEKRYKQMSERKDLDLTLAREELGHKTVKLEETTSLLQELESRFEGEFHRIRVRERELQNRLDILKHEGGAVVRHKDDLILDLKRQIEKLTYDMENFRKKNQNVYGQVEAQQDRIKRAMKALRVATSLLDGEEEKTTLKKAE